MIGRTPQNGTPAFIALGRTGEASSSGCGKASEDHARAIIEPTLGYSLDPFDNDGPPQKKPSLSLSHGKSRLPRAKILVEQPPRSVR